MHTPLSRYMTEHKLTDAQFAERIGKDRSLVNRLRRGRALPTLEVAALIERHTGGAVPMQTWPVAA